MYRYLALLAVLAGGLLLAFAWAGIVVTVTSGRPAYLSGPAGVVAGAALFWRGVRMRHPRPAPARVTATTRTRE